MGMQRPLGQAKKGVGHFVFPLPGRGTEKWQVKEENIKDLSQHNHSLMDENIGCFGFVPFELIQIGL